MKHIKTFLPTLLAILLGLPTTARDFIYDGVNYTVLSEEDLTCELTDYGNTTLAGDIVIPSKVSDGDNEYSVVKVGSNSFWGNSDITSINLSSGLKLISDNAFCGCTELRSVSFPEGLDSISDYAFKDCSRLASVELPVGLRSMGSGVFSDCIGLQSIELPVGLRSIGSGVFSKCVGLLSIEFPQSLTVIKDNTCNGCTALSSVVLSEGLVSIGDSAFLHCDSLVSVDLPEGLISIDTGAFQGCRKLEAIHIPSTVNNIGERVFCACSRLYNVHLPDGLTSISRELFGSCWNLMSINIPESVEIIESYAFVECFFLASVNLPKGLKEIGDYAFYGCKALNSPFPDSLQKIGKRAFSSVLGKSIDLPASLGEIGSEAFYGCLFTDILYVASTPITAEYDIFDENVYLTATLNMPNATLADVQATEPWRNFRKIIAKDGSVGFGLAAGDDFEYEGILYTIIDPEAKTVMTKEGKKEDWSYANYIEGDLIIPSRVSDGTDEYSVIRIGELSFYNNDKLTSVQLPDCITDIGDFAFEQCVQVNAIRLPETLRTIGMASFAHCRNLQIVNIPEGVTNLGGGAFSGCLLMASVEVPGTVTSIGTAVFRDCLALTNVILPESLTIIPEEMFHDCPALVSINLPGNLLTIGESAFNLTGLEKVEIPASVSSFGRNAFKNCRLTEVTYNAVVPLSASEDVFNSVYLDVYITAALNMPNATLADVQATEPWRNFRKIIAKDGSVGFGFAADDNFEYEGIIYTVISAEEHTCRTKEGSRRAGDVIFNPNFCTPGNNPKGDVVIPSRVSDGEHEYTVVEIGVLGFTHSDITSISIPESVTSIGEYAFNGSNISSVSLPESLEEIKIGTFQLCDNLSSINLPQSLKTLGASAFQECNALTAVVLPESISSIGGFAFGGCQGLQSVTLPATLPVCDFGVFDSSSNITEVTYLASTPVQCNLHFFDAATYRLATLYAPNATLSDIQNTVPWMAFQRIIASDGSIGVVANGDDFEYDGIWYTVIDSEAATCRTKAGESDFSSGNHVSGNIVIPTQVSYEGQNFHVVEVGDWSFYGCQQLITVQLPPSVERIGIGAFESCISLTSIELPETMTFIGAEAFRDCWELPMIKIPYGIKSLERLTFHNCWALTTIDIPSSVTLIGESAFELCYKLEAIDIPESVTEIGGHAFYDCNDLRIISLPASLKSLSYGVFASGADNSDTEQVNYMATIPIEASGGIFIDSVYVKAVLYMPNARLADIRGTVPWNLFKRIIAKDGSLGFEAAGDDFLYEGIWYTVTDVDAKTCETRGWGNVGIGDIVIPAQASDGVNTYSVVAIGENSFSGSFDLRSVTLPATITKIGTNAFADCERLTSLVWLGQKQLQNGVVEEIGNPNLLLYVDNLRFAPEGLDRNVVVNGICERLELTPGYPFTPVKTFTANSCRMVKDFTQKTYIGICAGWETIVLPFDVTEVYAENLEAFLIPFAVAGGNRSLRPYWLYEGDEDGLWKEASGIKAGVPYIISMPNNSAYPADCNVNGPVVFSNDEPQLISPETTAAYVVDWASGRQFRPLWLPLSEEEAVTAMGLNSGISGMTDDEGDALPPGSAFHTGVTPKPLEAYVSRLGSERAMMVMGNHSGVLPVIADSGLEVRAEYGKLYALSATDRELHIFTPEGALLRILELKAGVITIADDLKPGIYLVAGRKVMVK